MQATRIVSIADRFTIGGGQRFTLLAGPCAIESREMAFQVATELKQMCEELGVNYIFKASFDKANRSSLTSKRGVGMDEGLRILQEIKTTLDLPIVTDVHEAWQCPIVAQVADVLQIPAFLSRQTDLLVAAAHTGKVVNVKKGQFMAPWDMQNVVSKCNEAGNPNVMLCERGTTFGYNNLVVDMTGLVEMRQLGAPVVFDATHSVQKPGGMGTSTGGNRDMIPYLMRAALAVGVDAIFAEVHPDPDNAISDGPNQLYLSTFRQLLEQAIAVDDLMKSLAPAPESAPAICGQEATPATPALGDVKMILTDVDGVLTDCGMYYSEQGDELKKFNAYDGMGLQLAMKAGYKTGIITSENTELVSRRAKKLGLDYLEQGRRDGGKLAAARELCEREGITLANVAYVGDDVNCFELLSAVGVAACPASAVSTIKNIPGIIHLQKNGGQGCVRELVEMILLTPNS